MNQLRRDVRIVIAFALTIAMAQSSLLAVPQIQSELTYIENRPPDDIFGFPGLYVLTRCDATDTAGVAALIGPPAGATVSCNNNNFPFAQPTAMGIAVAGNTAIFIHLFPIAATDFPDVDGRYTYEVTNNSNQNDSLLSHRLNRLEVVQHPTNLAVSNQTTTPTITFTDPDPTPNVAGLIRRYQVVIYDASLNGVAILPSPTTSAVDPELTVGPGQLCPCESYYFRAQSIDIDTAEDATESMAQSFLFFSAIDVPNKTGDINHDCLTNGKDIPPFVTALLTSSTAVTDICPADFNLSGAIDVGDIAPLVNELISP
jgi:hypothetical protein